MKNTLFTRPFTRREFLVNGARGIGLLALTRYAPAFLAASARAGTPAPGRDRSILVVIQLAGGNDGLNTLIPYEDDHYYRLRPTLGIPRGEIVRISDQLGLHPALEPLARLHGEGCLSVIQNVGYPNPNRSHFRSMEIWETAANSDAYLDSGWLGRYLDNACVGKPAAGGDPNAVHITDELPQSYFSEAEHFVFGLDPRQRGADARDPQLLRKLTETIPDEGETGYLRHTLMDTLLMERRVAEVERRFKPGSQYPATQLGSALRSVSAMIQAGMETRVYFLSHGGFDTHVNQAAQHHRLLAQLAEAMAAFQADLRQNKLDDQVLTMTFSEFGRRPSENKGKGTDHGTAAPLFVMGGAIQQPIVGTAPNLDLAYNQDITYSTDFRQVYATVLGKWLGSPAGEVLGGDFKPLGFI